MEKLVWVPFIFVLTVFLGKAGEALYLVMTPGMSPSLTRELHLVNLGSIGLVTLVVTIIGWYSIQKYEDD